MEDKQIVGSLNVLLDNLVSKYRNESERNILIGKTVILSFEKISDISDLFYINSKIVKDMLGLIESESKYSIINSALTKSIVESRKISEMPNKVSQKLRNYVGKGVVENLYQNVGYLFVAAVKESRDRHIFPLINYSQDSIVEFKGGRNINKNLAYTIKNEITHFIKKLESEL